MATAPIPLVDERSCPGKRSLGATWGICIACTLLDAKGTQIAPAAQWVGTGVSRHIDCANRRVVGEPADSEGGEG